MLLLEKNSAIGMETSSRNSQVIHAGLYYPTDSHKAKWCVEGRHRLYEYCRERSVPVNRFGKLVVATTKEQAEGLRALHGQAMRNGVRDVELLTSREQVVEMEPELTTTVAALWSPSTGIVNVHELMRHLLTDAEEEGMTTLALNSEIKEARISDEGRVQLRVPPDDNENPSDNNDDEMWLDCDVVVNAAGLWADQVALAIHTEGTAAEGRGWQPPRQYFCKGTYFRLEGVRHSPFSRLVYPVPDPAGGLGVHATLDEGGQVKFGPDVEWIPVDAAPDELSYVPDPKRAQSFYDSIQRYWPGLPPDSLVPDYCGVRSKLSHPDLPEVRGIGGGDRSVAFHDFLVAGPRDHGVQGLVHLLGMESPGLTSALTVAEHVANLLEQP